MSQRAIQYIGKKPQKRDNVAGTGLTWVRGQTLVVAQVAAQALLRHPDIWRDVTDRSAAATEPSDQLGQQSADPAGQVPQGDGAAAGDQAQAPGDQQALASQPQPPTFDLPNLHGMTKQDISDFAKANFGADLDQALKKDEMIEKVVVLANSRAAGDPV